MQGPEDDTIDGGWEDMPVMKLKKEELTKKFLTPTKKAWREIRAKRYAALHPVVEYIDDRPKGERSSSRSTAGRRNYNENILVERVAPRRPARPSASKPPRPKRAREDDEDEDGLRRSGRERIKTQKSVDTYQDLIRIGPARPMNVLGFDAKQRLIVEAHLEAFGIPGVDEGFDIVKEKTESRELHKKNPEQLRDYGAALLRYLLDDANEVGGAAGAKKVTSQIARTHLLKEKLKQIEASTNEDAMRGLLLPISCEEEAGISQSRSITWGPVQDLLLLRAVVANGWGNWKKVCVDAKSGTAVAVMHHFGLPIERRRALSKELCALLPCRPSASHGMIRLLNDLLQDETTPEFKKKVERFSGDKITFARRSSSKNKNSALNLGPRVSRTAADQIMAAQHLIVSGDRRRGSGGDDGDKAEAEAAPKAVEKKGPKGPGSVARWTDDETTAMLRGVIKYGCNWTTIKTDHLYGPILIRRNNIKMKDKWRNLMTHIQGEIERVNKLMDGESGKAASMKKHGHLAQHLLEKQGLADRTLTLAPQPIGTKSAAIHVPIGASTPELTGRMTPDIEGMDDEFGDPDAKKKKKRSLPESEDLLGASAMDDRDNTQSPGAAMGETSDDSDSDEADDDDGTKVRSAFHLSAASQFAVEGDDDLVKDIMAASGSRTATGRVGFAAEAPNKDALDAAWVMPDELVWAKTEDGDWWPAKAIQCESTWLENKDQLPKSKVKLYPMPEKILDPAEPKPPLKPEPGIPDEDDQGEAAEEYETAMLAYDDAMQDYAESMQEHENTLRDLEEKRRAQDTRVRAGLEVQPFREAYDRLRSTHASGSELLLKALREAQVDEDRILAAQFKLDSRLLKRFADFCESRAEMIADACTYEYVGEDKAEDHASDDEELEAFEIAMRDALGNLVTTGYQGSDRAPTMVKQEGAAVGVTVLDLVAQNVVTYLATPGVRFRLKPAFSANKSTEIAISVGEVEASDTWPCSLKILISWPVMTKLIRVRDNDLWMKIDTMDGVVDASALHLQGAYPARERLNKLLLRSVTANCGPQKSKSDLFFVLPDCLASAGQVSLDTIDAREIARFCENAWKRGGVMPGDMELLNLSKAAPEGPRFMADMFELLPPAGQRACVNRLMLEGKQNVSDLLMVAPYHPVEQALVGDILCDPRPHPAKCSRFCRGLICPACLCCCTGPNPHCVTVCSGANKYLACTKVEMNHPLTKLSWWYPDTTLEPAGDEPEFEPSEYEDDDDEDDEDMNGENGEAPKVESVSVDAEEGNAMEIEKEPIAAEGVGSGVSMEAV